jgi:hypothetical protein
LMLSHPESFPLGPYSKHSFITAIAYATNHLPQRHYRRCRRDPRHS